jgi:hypothetical protein
MAGRFTGHSYCCNASRQLPEADITSPNSFQVVPSNRCNCICLIGLKSLALVESLVTTSAVCACFITFSRVRLLPHECTNHSPAKGSAPRSEHSRRTSHYVLNFVARLAPRWIVLENVIQLRDWVGFNRFEHRDHQL